MDWAGRMDYRIYQNKTDLSGSWDGRDGLSGCGYLADREIQPYLGGW